MLWIVQTSLNKLESSGISLGIQVCLDLGFCVLAGTVCGTVHMMEFHDFDASNEFKMENCVGIKQENKYWKHWNQNVNFWKKGHPFRFGTVAIGMF